MKKKVFSVVVLALIFIQGCVFRVNPPLFSHKLLSADAKVISLDEFKPKLEIDPFFPLRVEIANKSISVDHPYLFLWMPVVEGIELGNGFFIDSELNFSFNVAYLLELKKKPKFLLQCYNGEEKTDSPIFVLKRDKDQYEYESFGLFGSTKILYSITSNRFFTQSGDRIYEITFPSVNKLVRSISGLSEGALEVNQQGKSFISSGRNKLGSVVSYNTNNELVLDNLRLSDQDSTDLFTFIKKESKDILKINGKAQFFGNFEILFSIFRTKNSMLIYDVNNRGLNVKVKGNRVYVDSIFYNQSGSYYNCELN
ncbi:MULTISPECIES: hypothetical protein [Leptospira]|uniref:Putative lipoprotein n=1 Tax=Leptospira interrogans str. UI 12621 TaxID=1049937 RepID=A0A0F6H612_LEPIR|nr:MULTISPECIES: hypothetical protein [Leptospira]AJR13114.1 hypothetical protein LIL_10512 [Leptospira interrogans serovar Linhai str. 56609]EKO23661.1 putative lipoprotein [Leptospira interrogans str. UI 12621]EMN66499.1 putative lipoprotein [Leptospira interrogans serovar Grippotyphosa str. UI 08434]EMN82693.1 putative lipoprotein [Leptospira interrogans serovar Grippotyphosa str. UI 12764]